MDSNFLAKEIIELRKWIDREHLDLESLDEASQGYVDFQLNTIVEGIKKLYFLILAYLENLNFPYLAKVFSNQYQSILNDNSPWHTKTTHESEGIHFPLKILIEFENVLAPFQDFKGVSSNKKEINHLTEILKSTKPILNLTKTEKPYANETAIYKPVKEIIALYYPTARFINQARFISAFKTYKPDILVPELKTAIEYKYLKPAYNIDEYMDQVKVDSTRYVGDPEYDKFIAVFCLSHDLEVTKQQIQNHWLQMDFPVNWELIQVDV